MKRTACHLLFIVLFYYCNTPSLLGQPQPCVEENPEMTSTCEEACIICDIDGFTGRHESSVAGALPADFCTFVVHNAQWISFQAGSTDISIRLSVSNCQLGSGLEMTIYKSDDCTSFEQISQCRGGMNGPVVEGTPAEFTNTEPLTIGQFYYLGMDGAFGDNCDWTFEVLEGSTELNPLTVTAPILGQGEVCPEVVHTYTTEPESGAVLFDWTVDGQTVGDNTQSTLEHAFEEAGIHTLCVTARNACDEAQPTCRSILVSTIPPTMMEEKICEGDNFEIADTILNTTGNYEFLIVTEEGCDSLILVDLEAVPSSTTDLGRVNICEGDALIIGEIPYSETDIYAQVLPNFLGCDSTVIIDLFVVVCNIQGAVEAQDALCKGEATGGLTFSVSGGTPPFTYQWAKLGGMDSGSGNISDLNEAIQLTNLAVGTYLVTIEDNFDNQRILIGEVAEPEALAIEWMASDYNDFNISCFDGADGTIDLMSLGGIPPYSTLWEDDHTDASRQGLSSGDYVVTITDANACQTDASISLNQPSELSLSPQFSNPTCEGEATGNIFIVDLIGGVLPYKYFLNGESMPINNSIENLPSGAYSLEVVDENGCSMTTTGMLEAPEIPQLELGENKRVELADGIALNPQIATFTNSIQWRADIGLSCYDCLDPIASPVNPTTYYLTITSKDNCSTTDSISIQVIKIRDVYVPNAFSPNADGINDVLILHAGPEASMVESFQLFSRWGVLLYEENNFAPNSRIGWEGLYNGQAMESGVYLWIATIDFIDGEKLVYSGDVTLIR